MNLQTYLYNIITDTLNGKVAIDELVQQIQSSTIITALNHIDIESSNLYIIFKDVLSNDDKITLTNIINNHDGIKNIKNEPQTVKIIEEDPSGVNKTNGKFQVENIKMVIPATIGNYVKNISYKQYIGLLSANWFCNQENIGDEASFYVANDTVIGYVTEAYLNETYIIKVSDTVISSLIVGYYVSINGGEYIRIIGIDKINKTIKIDKNISNITINSLVKMRINILSNFSFNGIGIMTIGQSKIGSALLPPNTVMTLEYNNKNGLAKDFSLLIEYMY